MQVFNYLERDQEAKLIKCEADVPRRSKFSIACEERILHLVSDYRNRDPLKYLRGVSYNFEFDFFAMQFLHT